MQLSLLKRSQTEEFLFLERILRLLIKESKDEADFLALIFTKGISYLTYQYLKTHPQNFSLKETTLQALKTRTLVISTRNSYYQEELKKILTTFKENNLLVIPLKGLTLSWRLYKDINCRDESVDFDLLVKEEDKEKAKEILLDLGYSWRTPQEILKWQWFYQLSKPKQKGIELHWDITMMKRSKERIEGLWQARELVDWEGVEYYDFKPEELLLYLCSHLVNSDALRTLRAICDIYRLLEKYGQEINAQSLLEKAKRWQLLGSLYTGLKLQKDFFGLKFLEIKIPLYKKIFINFFAHKRVVLRGGRPRKILDKFLSYILFELFEASTLKDYYHIFKRVLFPPKEAIRSRSYCLRIIKGLVKLIRPET